MKNLLLSIAFLIAGIAVNAAVTPLANLKYVSNTTYAQGDTGSVHIWFPPGGYADTDTFTIKLWYSNGTLILLTKISFNKMEVDAQGYHVGVFTIPDDAKIGTAKIVPYTHDDAIITITSSTVDPPLSIDYAQAVSLNLPIHYFSEAGVEIEKPSKGFFIWKLENGIGGKCFIY